MQSSSGIIAEKDGVVAHFASIELAEKALKIRAGLIYYLIRNGNPSRSGWSFRWKE